MTKKLFSLLAAIVLALCFAVPIGADDAAPLILDCYELFDDAANAALEQRAEDASAGHDCNIYFVTIDDIGDNTAREYAKWVYTAYDLGYGDDRSGILFLVALDSRDYVTITYGGGVTAFTDYRIEQIENEIVPMLSDGNYRQAVETYIDLCGETLDYCETEGAPMDAPDNSGWGKTLIVLLVPLAVAGIACAIFYAQMKTARIQSQAAAYMPETGFTLHANQDIYTHTTETRIYSPEKDDHDSDGSSTESDGFGGSSGGKF